MIDYEKLYKVLFNAITYAIRDMDTYNFGLAKQRLIDIQQEAEDLYLNEED